jgi:hypothetical protein
MIFQAGDIKETRHRNVNGKSSSRNGQAMSLAVFLASL